MKKLLWLLVALMASVSMFAKTYQQDIVSAYGTVVLDWSTDVGSIGYVGNVTETTIYTQSNTISTTCIAISAAYYSSKNDEYTYAELSIEGGFKAGDVVSVDYCFNNSDNSKVATVGLFNTADSLLAESANGVNGRTADGVSTFQYELTEDMSAIRVARGSRAATRTCITRLQVIRTEPTYNVVANAIPSYAGTVDVTYSADHTQTTLTATPNPGYHFAGWSDGITINPRTIILTSDLSLTANFAQFGSSTNYVLDFTTQGTSINDWIINYATLNESNTNEDAGKYVYDIHGGIESESYVVSRPNIVFKVKNASDKQKAFVIYPGQGYEFGGKNGIICINGTSVGDRIRITCAAKGSTNASFEDGQGVYPKNAITITEDLTLPYKAEGAEDADEQGYRWKEIQYVSLGGDVEIKEFAGGFRVKRVEVEESGITTPTYTITADASPSYAGTVDVTYSADHTQATMTAMPNDGYYFNHWNDGNTENPRTVMLTQDIMYTAYFETDNSTPAALPFEETFTTRRGTTYIEKTDKGYWPYAYEWFEGYPTEGGNVEGNQYDNDYTSVSSYSVSIRGRKLNDESVSTVGLYFASNRSADECFVKFNGGLPNIPTGGAYLHFEICSSESDGGDLDAMIVKVNDAVVAIPHTELEGKLVTSIVTVPLNVGRITSLSFAFDKVPAQKFINRFWIDETEESITTYTVSTSVYPANTGTVEVEYSDDHSQATMTASNAS